LGQWPGRAGWAYGLSWAQPKKNKKIKNKKIKNKDVCVYKLKK